MDKKHFKENICRIRNSMNLTQAEMAEKLGISRQSYINLEHGKTLLVSKQLTRLSKLSGIPEEKLLFGYCRSELESEGLREIEVYKQRLSVMKESYDGKVSILEEKISVLSELHESEKKHLDTQKKYSDDLEQQLADGRRVNSQQRDEIKELKKQFLQFGLQPK